MPDPTPTWSWGGLRRGDPYGTGAPGKPLPAPPGQTPSGPGMHGTWSQRYGGVMQPQDWGAFKGIIDFTKPGETSDLQSINDYLRGLGRQVPPPLPGQQVRGEDPNAPFNFNVGLQTASVPLGESAGPFAPWAGWQPAQEEYT